MTVSAANVSIWFGLVSLLIIVGGGGMAVQKILSAIGELKDDMRVLKRRQSQSERRIARLEIERSKRK